MNFWTIIMVVMLVIAAAILAQPSRDWFDDRLEDLFWFLRQFRIVHPWSVAPHEPRGACHPPASLACRQ